MSHGPAVGADLADSAGRVAPSNAAGFIPASPPRLEPRRLRPGAVEPWDVSRHYINLKR